MVSAADRIVRWYVDRSLGHKNRTRLHVHLLRLNLFIRSNFYSAGRPTDYQFGWLAGGRVITLISPSIRWR